MVARFAIVVATLLAAGTALAETMTADAARRFVTGKLFAFNCFDGSRGAGRIYGDGSVIGSIQFRGSGPVRSVWLPAGTLTDQRRGGLRVDQGHVLRALLQCRPYRRPKLPRLGVGVRHDRLLRLHPPRERRRHRPAPAFVRAVVARCDGGARRQLIIQLGTVTCRLGRALLGETQRFGARRGNVGSRHSPRRHKGVDARLRGLMRKRPDGCSTQPTHSNTRSPCAAARSRRCRNRGMRARARCCAGPGA